MCFGAQIIYSSLYTLVWCSRIMRLFMRAHSCRTELVTHVTEFVTSSMGLFAGERAARGATTSQPFWTQTR